VKYYFIYPDIYIYVYVHNFIGFETILNNTDMPR
jgi:hypothetical protein